MSDAEVPTTSTFKEIYPEDAAESQRKRWNQLLSSFEKQYGRKADFISRSPGRVNIIGEHIDYSLYECLPMAVTADVLLAVSPSPSTSAEPTIRIANTHPSKFPTRSFPIPPAGTEVPLDPNAHDWSNYFKAGLRGAYELLKRKKGDEFRSVGMDILTDGTVPAGGGLSSSAAFVCAASLAAVRANGVESVDKKELVELAIVSERAVGVNSGGMDQSASVFAQRSSGLLISFHPTLNAVPITIPPSVPPTKPTSKLAFLIAQSFLTSNKRDTGPIHYNLRVVECTLAALYLGHILKLPASIFPPKTPDSSPLGLSLRSLHQAYFNHHGEGAVSNPTASPEAAARYTQQLQQLHQHTSDYLIQDDGYTRADIASILSLPVSDLEERYMSKVPVRAERFKLRQRALHVFSEALRVQRFVALLHDKSEREGADLHTKLGALVSETQDSCRDEYECSTEELDQLCEIAVREGAFGARLTGAGWGGCVVSLVPEEKVDGVRQAWWREYYQKRFPEMKEAELAEAVVLSRPGRGSLVFEVEGRGSL